MLYRESIIHHLKLYSTDEYVKFEGNINGYIMTSQLFRVMSLYY